MEEEHANDLSFVPGLIVSLTATSFVVIAGLVVGLPVAGVALISGATLFATSIIAGVSLRRRLRGMSDPAAAFDRMASPRLYGFKAISGSHVGGGLYHRVDLRPNERVIRYTLAFAKAWYSRDGYLSLTNERLIFVGSRLNLGKGTGMIDLSTIRSVAIARRLSPSAPLLGLALKAIVIETDDGRQHVYWPNLIQQEAFRQQIRVAAGLDDS